MNPVSPFTQTSPTKLWRDFREYKAVVFASQRPHSTSVWPGKGQAQKTWVWWSWPPVIPSDEGICVIHSVRTGSSAGGWWLARYPHTFWLQKPQSKIFPPPPPWSPTKVFPYAGGMPALPFLKRLSQEVIPHPPLLHPTPGRNSPAFPQKGIYGPCKNTPKPLHSTITTDYQMSRERYLA